MALFIGFAVFVCTALLALVPPLGILVTAALILGTWHIFRSDRRKVAQAEAERFKNWGY